MNNRILEYMNNRIPEYMNNRILEYMKKGMRNKKEFFGEFDYLEFSFFVTPTKEVSRFTEFLSRDSSLHFLRQRMPLSVQA